MVTMNTICLFILVLSLSSTEQFNLETCRSPLGIETGKILDSAFSSSSHAGINSTASKARIRSERYGWCPLNKISTTTYEYVEIDLVNLTVITLIELQGKFSQQLNEEYADAFRIEYRRDNQKKWIKYKDFAGQYILSGNANSHIPAMRDILPSLIAKQIRIIPIVTTLQPKHICMRLELYGCSYEDGPISYSIPQGDKRGYDVEFIDETYDGHNDNGTLKDGLGQLTDGILAGDDYRLADNVQGIGKLGYDWIGWRRKSTSTSNINLFFQFNKIQNFTSIRLHTSNLFQRDVHLFNSILIANCDDKITRKTFLNIPEDYLKPQARFVDASLNSDRGIVTNCLKLTLTFNNRSKWILISEVLFESKPIIKSIPLLTTATTITTATTNYLPPLINNGLSIIQYWHWLLFASSLLLLLIVLLVIFYLQWIQSTRNQKKIRQMTAHLKFDSSYQPISIKFPAKSRINCCYIHSNDNTPLDGNSTCSTSNNDMRRHLIISTGTSPKCDRATSGSDFGTISTASPATMSTVYQSVLNPYLTAVTQDALNVTSNPYASIDVYTNPITFDETICIENPLKSIQGPCGNSTYQSLSTAKDSNNKPTISYIPDEQLVMEERYSTIEGCFGTIVRGYIYLRQPYDILKPILIKALITNDSIQKELFNQEHELMNRLSHPNLVQFFGYSIKQNYALVEHSNLGDLHTFLSTKQRLQQDEPTISLNIRLLIITQLSNALRYLESENIVHRDVSARNCLIYPNYEIKLMNSAIVSMQFQSHYFNINNCRLPVRWMAPETILPNEFSCQSDVWSFGITLWEVMTNCLTLPYALLTNEEVYQRLRLMGTNVMRSSGSLQLSKPEYLSKELVDLMLECWRPYGERPTFHEIFTFFNKRLDGINII
ncbi:unnamed protein product [Rotaria socialis]|nr:unnamed protein product [Rotaria socialis]